MKNLSFRFLVFGQTLANAGDVFYIVALISIVYEVTNSMFFVSLVPLCNMVSGFLSSVIAPLLIDKFNLKKILFLSQLNKTLVLLVLTLFTSFYVTDRSIYLIFIIVFAISFLDGWANPASSAIIPRLVSEKELIKANSLLSSLSQFIQLAGWAIGGILVALLHSKGLFCLTFALYVLSTYTIALIKLENSSDEKNESNNNKISSIVEGWKLIIENKTLRTIHLLIFLSAIASPVWVSAILYPFILNRLNAGTEWWGYINTCLLIGFFLAGIYGYKRSEILEKKISFVIILSSFFIFVCTLAFGLNTIPWVSLIFIAIYGIFQELNNIFIHTLIQNIAQDKILAKVYAAEGALIMITFGISTMVMGVIGEYFSSVAVFLVASFFLCISFTVAFKMKKQLSLTVIDKISSMDN
ncbi:MFS transporter [Bacillus sp. AFS055030]|uniref:MFS transporter n=1 Tax=Bacillus sp. AFS055030 TaxID=2033507 RepID=UPI0015D494E3|nr:MFS transporter [Bacillus sp. AFS055030]